MSEFRQVAEFSRDFAGQIVIIRGQEHDPAGEGFYLVPIRQRLVRLPVCIDSPAVAVRRVVQRYKRRPVRRYGTLPQQSAQSARKGRQYACHDQCTLSGSRQSAVRAGRGPCRGTGAPRVARPGLFRAVEAPRPRCGGRPGPLTASGRAGGAFLAVEAAAFGDLETLVAVNAPQVNAQILPQLPNAAPGSADRSDRHDGAQCSTWPLAPASSAADQGAGRVHDNAELSAK